MAAAAGVTSRHTGRLAAETATPKRYLTAFAPLANYSGGKAFRATLLPGADLSALEPFAVEGAAVASLQVQGPRFVPPIATNRPASEIRLVRTLQIPVSPRGAAGPVEGRRLGQAAIERKGAHWKKQEATGKLPAGPEVVGGATDAPHIIRVPRIPTVRLQHDGPANAAVAGRCEDDLRLCFGEPSEDYEGGGEGEEDDPFLHRAPPSNAPSAYASQPAESSARLACILHWRAASNKTLPGDIE
jgi:hypothetical protein